MVETQTITPDRYLNFNSLGSSQGNGLAPIPEVGDEPFSPVVGRRWRSDSARGLKRYDIQNVNILVVDDDKVQRSILNKWLAEEGYKNVTMCKSGKEAWTQLTETSLKYDLVVTDLMMPGITGDTLLEMIKEHPGLGSLPVILMSGEDKRSETAASAIRGGSQDFLFKPLVKLLFLRKIATVLENLLIKEREAAYETLMTEKEEEIKKLTNEVSQLANANMKVMKAIETPIEGITKTLSKILKDDSLKDLAVKRDLEDIFFTIRTNKDLYAPAIMELLKQDMNPEAKSLLLSCTEHALGRRTSLPTFPIVLKEDSILGLKHWDFNVLRHNEKDLLPLLKSMFEDFNLMERFQIPVTNLERFLMAVQSQYLNNPYHNFYHAFDVTQTVYCILTTMNGASLLTHLDIFSILIAAICHDVGHPGLSNAYLVTTESELAVLYNDRSVLENHHAATAFKLLKKPECDLTKNLSPIEKKELRTSIIAAILATDMGHHFTHTAKLEQRIKSGKTFDREDKNDRLMLMEAILKMADISNIAKPFDAAKRWGEKVADESFAQGDLEKKEGRAPMEHMDRTKTTFARNTANFIDLFGLHLYELMAAVLPETKKCITIICENRKKYADLIEHEKKQEQSCEASSEGAVVPDIAATDASEATEASDEK